MPERVFLGWDRPFLRLLTQWLLSRKDELPSLLVVVPTAQSGRRLREALAEAAGAILAPRVVTPDYFLDLPRRDDVASRIEARFAWIEVLREMPTKDFPHLFPVEPVERSFAWASGVTEEIEKMRNSLTEGGKNFADARGASPEKDRWGDLIEVERHVAARLAQWRLEDPILMKPQAAAGFTMPDGFRHLVVAGVPDPVPLAVKAWQKLEREGARVHVLIHAPANEGEDFDAWGRPEESWIKRPTPVPREKVHVTAGPPDAARKVLECLAGLASDEVSIGLCDPACGSALETAFAEAGWKAWNPEGRTAGSAMILMLGHFAALARRGDHWEPTNAILRNPLTAEILGRKGMHAALRLLDDIEENHLPDSAGRVMDLCEQKRTDTAPELDEGAEKLSTMLSWCSHWRNRFASGDPAEALAAWVFTMEKGRVADGANGQLLDLLAAAVPFIKRLENRGLLEVPGEALELMLSSMDSLRSPADREDAVIDLLGWLELPYSTGQRLVLAGMHEGCVPDGNMDDAFLPDGIRRDLELRHANTRHARDAYLFQALAASRDVEVIVTKVDAAGEPRRPSRLLLAAEGLELAQRVQALAGSPASQAARLASWDRGAWLLDLEGPVKPYLDGTRKLSPSAIRDYLHCPFRFYLTRVLKWQRHDAGKMEMDELDFGNLCHDALEQMGKHPEMVITRNATDLRDFLWQKMDERLARYGTGLSLPLLVQREAARTRLERFAHLEVEQRQDGWRTLHVEMNVGVDLAWDIEGQAISMQVDRIDHHPREGWRVLDYKTSAKAVTPRYAHLQRASAKRRFFGPTLPSGRNSEDVWKNVQVPLYAAFVKQWQHLDAPPAIGYVNLPATLNDVAFEMWPEFTMEHLENAMEWSREIIRAMRAGLHWPPVDLNTAEASYDDFALLAPDGLASAVRGSLIDQMKQIAADWDAERRPA